MTTLDQQIDASLREIVRRRKTKLTVVVLGLVLAVGTMIALTSLMYSPSAENVDKDRVEAQPSR